MSLDPERVRRQLEALKRLLRGEQVELWEPDPAAVLDEIIRLLRTMPEPVSHQVTMQAVVTATAIITGQEEFVPGPRPHPGFEFSDQRVLAMTVGMSAIGLLEIRPDQIPMVFWAWLIFIVVLWAIQVKGDAS